MKFFTCTVGFLVIFVTASALAQQSLVHMRNQQVLTKIKKKDYSFLVDASPSNYVNDLVSDFGVWVTERKVDSVPFAYSRKVKVCTTNLMNVSMVRHELGVLVPAQHVSILIDDYQYFEDPGGGEINQARFDQRAISCQEVPIYTGTDDMNFADRVKCIGKEYAKKATYAFFNYNCAGFVRDVLFTAGSELPTFPNAGIGIQYESPTLHSRSFLNREVQKDRTNLYQEIAPACWAKFGYHPNRRND